MFAPNNLYDHIEAIEEITMRAEKKFNLAKKLKTQRDEMKALNITIAAYKGTFLVKGIDDINTCLDDQIVQTQTMMGSPYMRGRLKNETKNWDKKLNDISELMEAIMSTQRTWMYLEPIFSSGDIAKTMPQEGLMFNFVDETWRNTMNRVQDDPGIMELAEIDNILNMFNDCNKKLDKIQKSLSDYLEQKRLVFARFFFLANEDLL
jgi:dynein heavy chain